MLMEVFNLSQKKKEEIGDILMFKTRSWKIENLLTQPRQTAKTHHVEKHVMFKSDLRRLLE